MYDLAGFEESKKGVADLEADNLHRTIEQTLSRYNCTNVEPSSVQTLLSPGEL